MRYSSDTARPWFSMATTFSVAAILVTGVCAGPGDYKGGYESLEYETRSVAVDARTDRARPADLVANVQNPPLGLPPVPLAAHDSVAEAKVQLGRKLFYDRRLSLNDAMSCAMCHVPEQGFANNELALAVGVEGRTGSTIRDRNTETLCAGGQLWNIGSG